MKGTLRKKTRQSDVLVNVHLTTTQSASMADVNKARPQDQLECVTLQEAARIANKSLSLDASRVHCNLMRMTTHVLLEARKEGLGAMEARRTRAGTIHGVRCPWSSVRTSRWRPHCHHSQFARGCSLESHTSAALRNHSSVTNLA